MSARQQIVSRLSEDSMGGIATLHDVTDAEQLVDTHRAEVLAADGQAYDGELAMLRSLRRTLRAVTRYGTDIDEVRKLLAEHTADDAAARLEAKEKSSPARADATPGPTGRVAQLLDAIRISRGRWTTVRAYRFYRDHVSATNTVPNTQLRAVARGDLRDLAAWGHLTRHEEPGCQYYTLKTRKDGRP